MQRALVAAAMALGLAVPIQTQMASKGLTDVPGIKVGSRHAIGTSDRMHGDSC